jgi:hypothetical protein
VIEHLAGMLLVAVHRPDPLTMALTYQQRLDRFVERQEAKAEARREARQERRERASDGFSRGKGRTAPVGDLPALLALIRDHESGGNYSAYNASGCEGYGCGGAYQLHAAYAPTWAARAGYPGMGSNAATWPAAIQDAVALNLFHSTNPDGAHWCNWTEYC